MKHSIIIPTAGPAPFLPATLASLVQPILAEGDSEAVVVENGPQSGTESTVGTFRSHLRSGIADKIRYVHEPVPGLLAGRHRGVFETSGDIVSFFDDDVIVGARIGECLEAAFRDTSVELVGGPSRPLLMAIPPKWLIELAEKNDAEGFMMTFLSLIDLRSSHIVDMNAGYVFGQNFHIRRDTFFDLGGFHPDIVPGHLAVFQGDGETGLTRKFEAAGRRADYRSAVSVAHVIPSERMTLEFVYKRAVYDGVCRAYSGLRQSDEQPPLRAIPDAGAAVRRMADSLLRRMGIQTTRPPRSDVQVHRASGRNAGRAFFLDAYSCSDVVREWVHRPNYLDFRYPENAVGESERLLRMDAHLPQLDSEPPSR